MMDEQLLLNCLIVVEKQTADQQTIFIMIFLEGNIVLQTYQVPVQKQIRHTP